MTNSRQALDHAAAEGFQLIEADLCWTTDGQLVLLHDWEGAFEAMFQLDPGPRSLEDFLALEAVEGMQQLGLTELAAWLVDHPRVGLVTDIKTERLAGLDVLAEQLVEVRDQVVPQVHDAMEAQRARALGFDAVILTLYASTLSDDEVLDVVRGAGFYAVTMPKQRALDGLAGRLAAEGVTTFAHTVNNQLMATRLVRAGAHGVYTDRLTPARSRRDAAAGADPWVLEEDGAAEGGPADVRNALVVDLRDSLDPRCGALRVLAADEGTRVIELEAHMSGGVRPHRLDVVPGPDGIPLEALFPGELPAWISAPGDVQLELRWELLDRPVLVRRSTRGTPAAWHARGPVDQLGGLALFLLNPGAEPRTVELSVGRPGSDPSVRSRTVDAHSVLVERLPLDGEAGLLELSVTGGGVVVQLLRAGPECSLVR